MADDPVPVPESNESLEAAEFDSLVAMFLAGSSGVISGLAMQTVADRWFQVALAAIGAIACGMGLALTERPLLPWLEQAARWVVGLAFSGLALASIATGLTFGPAHGIGLFAGMLFFVTSLSWLATRTVFKLARRRWLDK